MENETIFYNILYQDADAVKIIPEIDKAYNMTPHRIIKDGETITIHTNRTIGLLQCITGLSWIHPIVNTDDIKLVWESNTTNATRVARIIILYCDPSGCKKLLHFVTHLN